MCIMMFFMVSGSCIRRLRTYAVAPGGIMMFFMVAGSCIRHLRTYGVAPGGIMMFFMVAGSYIRHLRTCAVAPGGIMSNKLNLCLKIWAKGSVYTKYKVLRGFCLVRMNSQTKNTYAYMYYTLINSYGFQS